MSVVDFFNLLVAALLLAGIYAVMSVGMTVIYGVMKIVNLAHAGFIMLGAYFAYELFERLHIDPVLAALGRYGAVALENVKTLPPPSSTVCEHGGVCPVMQKTFGFSAFLLGKLRSAAASLMPASASSSTALRATCVLA